jgi:hypothetical protein
VLYDDAIALALFQAAAALISESNNTNFWQEHRTKYFLVKVWPLPWSILVSTALGKR